MVKSKLKPLLPTLKEKKRYLAFEIISNNKIKSFSKVFEAIWQSFLEFLGLLGASRAGILILPDKWNNINQRGIIRVNNKYLEHLKASLLFVQEIENNDVIIRTLGVSGILKKATNKYLVA
jgi:ribonuclease P/MRP protein subunit POP5